ncbi:hypothetical protein BGZ75_008278 [Mortierella antarctica]|nr:hypothetical protein BGZ75_008278 [Mortierella antarctica]
MLGLLSAPSGTEAVQAFKAALPIGLGLASAAFLTIKAATRDTQNVDKIIRDIVTPNLALFTPRIVERMLAITDRDLGHSEGRKLIENPLMIFQEMIASAMATVFMGHEIGKQRKVLDTFIDCTGDLARLLDPISTTNTWRPYFAKAKYGVANPLQKHIRVLVEAATPVVQERRRQEAEALEKGIDYTPPLDIMQNVLDNFDKYGIVDLEDVCGHLLVIVLVSVHTTSDSSTYLSYFLAAFPEYIDELYQEQLEVLDQICREREEQRQSKLKSGEIGSVKAFAGTDLDPRNDQDFSSLAVKRMVKMDSFVRESMRFRADRASVPHTARRDVVLSNGMTIRKGRMIMVNFQSTHLNPGMQGEDPAEFRPWRFVGKGKAATKVGTDFLFFGMGKHACPGRFLAIQEVKTVGALMVSRYSKIELQDPSQRMKALRSLLGEKVPTGLYFTRREAKNDSN